jgi:hypothetical protein
MSSNDDHKDSFPYFESDNYHGWFIQFKSHCRGIGAHLALKARPTHPVDVNGNPSVLNQAQARALAKLQATWDEHDDKAFSALMKACIKDPKTKKLTETEDFEHALPLLNRLEERYVSDADRQKGVAWSPFFNFTAQASESGMDPVTRFDGIVRQLHNLGEPVTPAQLYHQFLEASLQSKGTHHLLLATAIFDLRSDESQIREECPSDFTRGGCSSGSGAPEGSGLRPLPRSRLRDDRTIAAFFDLKRGLAEVCRNCHEFRPKTCSHDEPCFSCSSGRRLEAMAVVHGR